VVYLLLDHLHLLTVTHPVDVYLPEGALELPILQTPRVFSNYLFVVVESFHLLVDVVLLAELGPQVETQVVFTIVVLLHLLVLLHQLLDGLLFMLSLGVDGVHDRAPLMEAV